MLNIKARFGDILDIGGVASIRVGQHHGQFVALVIQADRTVPIRRLDVDGMRFVDERDADSRRKARYYEEYRRRRARRRHDDDAADFTFGPPAEYIPGFFRRGKRPR